MGLWGRVRIPTRAMRLAGFQTSLLKFGGFWPLISEPPCCGVACHSLPPPNWQGHVKQLCARPLRAASGLGHPLPLPACRRVVLSMTTTPSAGDKAGSWSSCPLPTVPNSVLGAKSRPGGDTWPTFWGRHCLLRDCLGNPLSGLSLLPHLSEGGDSTPQQGYQDAVSLLPCRLSGPAWPRRSRVGAECLHHL